MTTTARKPQQKAETKRERRFVSFEPSDENLEFLESLKNQFGSSFQFILDKALDEYRAAWKKAAA